MNFIKKNWVIISIILAASLIRIVNLGNIPIGFNDDEAAFGYNAYSILTTGRDEWGRLLPFPVFESFGDWKLVGYLYLTVLSQAVFGVSEFATRLPSAIFGILSVFSTYLLTKELFSKKNVAQVAALFLAISPWHIISSRNAFESDILIFIITISTYFFLRGIKNPRYLKFAFIGFASSFYIYRSSWLFVPLFVATLLILNKEKIKKYKSIIFKNITISMVILLPLLPTVLTFQGQSRFFQESFIYGVQKTGIINNVNQKRGICYEKLPTQICTITDNKYITFLTTYLSNYISNLSPQTYYINGVPGGYQSFSTRSMFFLFELPLLIIGLVFLKAKKLDASKILISWILLVPIGASITGVGNPGRLNILMPVPQIIAAFGFVSIYKIIKFKKFFAYTMSLIILFSFVKLTQEMFLYYPKVSGKYQRYGYKQLFTYLENQRKFYKTIAVSRKSDDAKQYIHYLFYNKIDPSLFNNPAYTVKYRGKDSWQVVEKIGNVEFYSSVPRLEDLPQNSLLAASEKEVQTKIKPNFVVNYLNGDRAFEVYNVDELKKELNEN